MHNWSIAIAVSILSSFVINVYAIESEAQQIEFAPNSQDRQDARTRQINFTLNTQSAQTFADLMQQAELVATNLIQQGFAQSSSVQEMSVSILAERNGQEAPLLMSNVSRPDWQKQPIIPQWTRYFYSSAALLGFLNPSSDPSSSPPNQEAARQLPSPTQPSSGSTPPTSEQPSPSTPVSVPTPPTISPSTTRTTPPAPPSPVPETSRPGGASLEENDPGYR